jgi:hypothetical protein
VFTVTVAASGEDTSTRAVPYSSESTKISPEALGVVLVTWVRVPCAISGISAGCTQAGIGWKSERKTAKPSAEPTSRHVFGVTARARAPATR